MEKKIKYFLVRRCADNSLAQDDKFAAGISACIAYLLSEILELANNYRKDNSRSCLVPVDISLGVFYDEELRSLFRYSKVFWLGVGQIPDAQ